MRIVWQNKFIFWNLMALIFVKALFSYSGLQFASLIDGTATFSRTEVVAQTNIFRSALGLSQLKENPTLDVAAAQKLQDMIQNQYFAHTSPAGVSPWYWIEVNQYKYSYAGENLAIGFLSAQDTVNAWANSPTHRANLANTSYSEIGIAVAPANIDNSQGFLVVQLFGTPKPIPVTKTVTKTDPIGLIKPTPTPATMASSRTPTTTQAVVSISPAVHSAAETNVQEPIVSKISNASPKFDKAARTFDAAFMIYALLAFLASLVIAAFYGLKKELVIRTTTSFAILVLAVVIPVIQISHKALII